MRSRWRGPRGRTPTIDLAVGSWNLALARLIPGITHGSTSLTCPGSRAKAAAIQLGRRSSRARAHGSAQRYDLVVNFEPDIRSNALAWLVRRAAARPATGPAAAARF